MATKTLTPHPPADYNIAVQTIKDAVLRRMEIPQKLLSLRHKRILPFTA